jgi:MFS family permease
MSLTRLWRRELPHYPDAGPRVVQLAIVVLVTIALYYELYVGGSVGPQILAGFHVPLTFLIMLSIVGNGVGAFTSLAAGIADRWGRANFVVVGLFITGCIVAFGLPHAHTAAEFFSLAALVGVVEGMVLVATPALVRDFSPQLGRASAMGFWTIGPVLGSLVVTVVSSHTLPTHPRWQYQYELAGAVGLIVFVIALIGLRELPARIRAQLIVSSEDVALVEARAPSVDADLATRHSWRQMMRADIVLPSFAVAVFLLFYYIAVGFFVIYYASNFGYSSARANALASWYWATNALALIIGGQLSDRLRVRKPFMLIGALVSATGVALFAATTTGVGYYTYAAILIVIGAGGGVAYCAWMAAFTETIERHNPATMATGLGIWGSTIRIVVSVSLIGFLFAVPAVSTLVDHGTQVRTLAAKYSTELRTEADVAPATLQALAKNPNDPVAGPAAVGQLMAKERVSAVVAIRRLHALGQAPKADLAYLQRWGTSVEEAAAAAPGQWRTWWWVCFAGQIAFLPSIWLLTGRWSPRRARNDERIHLLATRREQQAVPKGSPSPGGGEVPETPKRTSRPIVDT